MPKYYTGIGSRETPEDIASLIKQTASFLAKHKYVLRSGGADGSDTYFEVGCDNENGLKEIYLPWQFFNNNQSNLFLYNLKESKNKAEEIASKFHPVWNKLSQGVKKLHTRNVYQVLGKDLKTPSKFVVCYCPIEKGEWKGGTAQALKISKFYDIKIFNLFLEEDVQRIKKVLDK